MKARLGAVAALTLAGVLALAGCTPDAEPAATDEPAPTVTAQGGENALGETEAPKPPTQPENLSCDTLIPQSLVDQYTEMGWSSQKSEIYAADAPLAGSIMCTWGDYAKASSDAVQMYGWGIIDDATATAMQQALVDQGWDKETDGARVYITTDRSTDIDDDGYGNTYVFYNGTVTYADTKQALLLVNPR